MTINDFANLVLEGIHPVIEFKKGIEDLETYAEPGMRARVTGAVFESDQSVKLWIDYSEFDTFNQALEQANYYDKKGNPTLTARQAGFYTPLSTYHFEQQDNADSYFCVVEDASLKLYERYKQFAKVPREDGGRAWSYVQWLEHFAARQIGI